MMFKTGLATKQILCCVLYLYDNLTNGKKTTSFGPPTLVALGDLRRTAKISIAETSLSHEERRRR